MRTTEDNLFKLCVSELSAKKSPSPKKKAVQSTLAFGKSKATSTSKPPLEFKKVTASNDGGGSSSPVKSSSDDTSQDNSFREFRKICIRLAEEPSYLAKSKIMADFFTSGSSGGKLTEPFKS